MESPVVPSKVEDREWITFPPEEDWHLVRSDGWENFGKWILVIVEAELAFLDKTWIALQSLIDDGTLLMLKSSTTLLKHEKMMIHCYTKGGSKEEAKRTAQVIRATVDIQSIMYYKMNKLSQAGVACRYGHKNVTTYMHTYCGRFYIRDTRGDWISEEKTLRDVPISGRFLRENYSGSAELPSTSKKRCVNLTRTAKGDENWCLKCSISETNGEYLPEADRVWIVATELLEEGHFAGISWIKYHAREVVEVRLYVTENTNLSSQLTDCDRILKGAAVGRLMYFTRGNARDIWSTYKYTAEGELYEQTAFGDKFVLQRE